ncbi:MAG: hypothetical protein LBO08_02005 [Rickettsiales bacterium]|jgi:hypothetical protein|nr:hypothetical protein [Rickettsiales bacterium]
MKKILMTVAMIGIAGGANAALFDNCERVSAAGTAGDYVVKCPASADLAKIAKMKPDSKFASAKKDADGKPLNIFGFMQDDENIYINVLTNGCFRIMNGTDASQNYAVEVCR